MPPVQQKKRPYADNQRSVGLQTVTNDRTYISPNILTYHKLEHQEFHSFFIRPKTLTSLGLLILLLNFLARSDFLSSASEQMITSTEQVMGTVKSRGAVLGTVFAFICFATIHFPNTIMIRPHPIFWRAIMGFFTLYSMFLTYIFLMPVEEARLALRYFDPELGKPLGEMSYAEDCRLYTPENPESKYANFMLAFWDVHTLAHLLGWFGKMLIMRDWYVAWICSAGFEWIEISFRYWLPNFWECWWDHLILDLFGCNLLGIIIGSYVLQHFGVSKIDWLRGRQLAQDASTQTQAQCSNMMLSLVNKLRPDALERYEWSGMQSLRRFLGVTVFIVICLLIDSNNFFLKALLWVPPEHDILKTRVVLWGWVAVATSKEWYEYVSNPNCRRLGPFAWLTFYTSLIELSAVLKFADGQFNAPLPWFVRLGWSIIGVLFCFGLYRAGMNSLRQEKIKFNPYNPQIDVTDHRKEQKKHK